MTEVVTVMQEVPITLCRGLLLSVLLLPLNPETSAAANAEPSGSGGTGLQTTQEEDSPETPVATEKDTVLVEASLPYVPTSNTIATKLPVDLSWTPANVGVVSAPLLEEQHAVVLGDALVNISGVNAQTGFGIFDFFVVRGYDSLSSGLVLTDGAPEPEVTFYQMYNTERVELLKGPGGFLYGPNPLASAVNIVRKQPTLSNFAAFSATVGSFDTWEGALDINRASTSGALSFRVNGLWRETEGYRDGRVGEIGAVNPTLTWRPNSTSTLNLNFEHLSSNYSPDAGIPLVDGKLPNVPRSRSFASPFDRSKQDLERFQIDFEQHLSDSLIVRNKAYYRDLDWISDGTLLGFVLPAPEGRLLVTRSLLLLQDRQEFVGNQFEILWTARTGRMRHRFLGGLEIARFEDRFDLDVALLPPIDLFRPLDSSRKPFFLLPGQSSAGDSRSVVVAPYLIDEIGVTSHLQFLLGARYDSIDFDDTISGTSRSDGEVSPIAGVVYRPAAGLSLYANVARSFAPPSPRVVGDRRPEASRQKEIGARQELVEGRLRLTLAAYELERDNIAIPDDNGFTQQVGDQRARGVEIELAMELTRGYRGLLAYGYSDSELTNFSERLVVSLQPPTAVTIDRSGNRAAFVPEHLARFWLSKQLAGGFTLAGGLRYVGEQFIAEDNSTQLEAYVLADLSLAYSNRAWRISLHLQNLTDERYETRGFGSTSVIPGPPFSATLGLQYRF